MMYLRLKIVHQIWIMIWFWVTPPLPSSMVKDHTFALLKFKTLPLGSKTLFGEVNIFGGLYFWRFFFLGVNIFWGGRFLKAQHSLGFKNFKFKMCGCKKNWGKKNWDSKFLGVKMFGSQHFGMLKFYGGSKYLRGEFLGRCNIC